MRTTVGESIAAATADPYETNDERPLPPLPGARPLKIETSEDVNFSGSSAVVGHNAEGGPEPRRPPGGVKSPGRLPDLAVR